MDTDARNLDALRGEDEDALKELKHFLFKETVRIENEKKALKEDREKLIRERAQFRKEIDLLNHKMVLEHKRLKDEMEKDKAKSQVLPISQLGIMQMTRQRHAQSNSSGIYTTCPYCGGKGIVKSARTMSAEIQRKIVATCRSMRANNANVGELALLILLHPDNLQRLQTEDYEHLINLEKAYNLKLTFRADPSYHLENFRIIDARK